MSRRVVAAVAVLFFFTAFVVAAEIKGKVSKVDAENNKITITVDDKDQEFSITKDTKIIGSKGGEVKNGLKSKAFSEKALKRGITATITTEKQGDKEIVKELKISGGKKGGKSDK